MSIAKPTPCRQPPTIVPEFTDAHFAAVGKIVGPSKDHAPVAR